MFNKFLILNVICFLLLFNINNEIKKVDCFSLKRESNANEKGEHQHSSKNNLESVIEYEEDENGKSDLTKTNLMKKCEPCPESILCVPQIQCPAHVRMNEHEKPQICDLPGGKFGYCCFTGQNHTADNYKSDQERFGSPVFLPMHLVEAARRKFEKMMHDITHRPVPQGHPEFMHGIVFHSNPKEDMNNFHLSNSAMEQVITSQMFVENQNIPLDDIVTNNIHAEFTETPLAHHCARPSTCSNVDLQYRTFDGKCNNPLLNRGDWGSAGQPMERLLPPAYEDGIWKPRSQSVDGSPLAGARDVSRILLADIDRPHPKNNLLLMQFGQFIAHDVTQSASVRLENGEVPQCCEKDGVALLPPELRHFACMPIPVSPNDEFYRHFGVRCMNFVRLSLAPSLDCRMSYGKQRSKVTHFLDASPVYGSSMESARDLRSFKGGRLRMFNDFGRELLPLTNDKRTCGSEQAGMACFESGDGRTNQIISLIALHILLAREHNRIADTLAAFNPNWSDETLYQESRRIVIAELQHIIYNEYLPLVIGPMQMKRFRLEPQPHGYADDYNPNVNPAITNEFSGAAFRMGHSSVDGKFHIHQDNSNIDEIINIPDVMFNPSRMRKRSFYNDMLRTLVQQPMQKVDSSITHGLSRFLFRGHSPFGLDLAALNIQRGRDHGLRPYNDYLELMGNRKLENFKQLPPELSHKLSQVYHHPEDIDLWIGGLLEKAVEGGIVGATFAEIIADQFSRFKLGDRYFYENSGKVSPGAFSPEQLSEIRKASMARLICDNSDHIGPLEVPPAAFIRADFKGNQPVRCDSSRIPSLNLEAWRF